MIQYRHGDVLVEQVDGLPRERQEVSGLTLAYGEATGHSHRIAENDGRAQLWRAGKELFVEIREQTATLVHDEHGPIVLGPGVYRAWIHREYVPSQDGLTVDFRPVID